MCRALRYSPAARLARLMLSPSALLIAIMSASSTRPFLMPCSSSPAPGSISARKKISHVADRGFGLAYADGFDQHHIEAGGLAQQHRLPRLRGDTAKRAGGGRGPDIGAVGSREMRHPGLVGEDRAAGAGGGGINREHRHLVAALDQEHAEH